MCNRLNQLHKRERGWKRLGLKLKIENHVLESISVNEDKDISYTKALFNHLSGYRVDLTKADLILALDSIGRKDTLSLIKDYIPDLGGVVDEFLERKRALPKETEV